MKVLVVAEHMGERVDLDEAVEALVPHEFPQLDVLPGVAHAVQLGLGLLGVAADDLVDGGALVDLVDDKALDLSGVVADDLHLVELGPQVEVHVVHAVDVEDLPHKGVGHHVQAEGGQHDHHDGPLQRQHDVLQLHRPEDLLL